jgi:hypothetical protein
MKNQLNFKLVSKDCTTCGETNQLAVIDLIKSFYLRTPYENLVARHYCHSCHAGWDVRYFSGFSFAWFLSAIFLYFLLMVLIVPPRLLTLPFVTLASSTQVLIVGTLTILLLIFLALSFFVQVFLVKILPLKKQNG